MSKSTGSTDPGNTRTDGHEPNYAAAQYQQKATAQIIAQAKWPLLSTGLDNVNEWTNKTLSIFKQSGAMMLLLAVWTPLPLNELADFITEAESSGLNMTAFSAHLRAEAQGAKATGTPSWTSPESLLTPIRARPTGKSTGSRSSTSTPAPPSTAAKNASAQMLDKYLGKARLEAYTATGAVYTPSLHESTTHSALAASQNPAIGADSFAATQLELLREMAVRTVWVARDPLTGIFRPQSEMEEQLRNGLYIKMAESVRKYHTALWPTTEREGDIASLYAAIAGVRRTTDYSIVSEANAKLRDGSLIKTRDTSFSEFMQAINATYAKLTSTGNVPYPDHLKVADICTFVVGDKRYVSTVRNWQENKFGVVMTLPGLMGELAKRANTLNDRVAMCAPAKHGHSNKAEGEINTKEKGKTKGKSVNGHTPKPRPHSSGQDCRMFMSGNCRFGDKCRHMHNNGPTTQPKSDATHSSPPTQGKINKPCFEWANNGSCKFGSKCNFSHDSATNVSPKKGEAKRAYTELLSTNDRALGRAQALRFATTGKFTPITLLRAEQTSLPLELLEDPQPSEGLYGRADGSAGAELTEPAPAPPMCFMAMAKEGTFDPSIASRATADGPHRNGIFDSGTNYHMFPATAEHLAVEVFHRDKPMLVYSASETATPMVAHKGASFALASPTSGKPLLLNDGILVEGLTHSSLNFRKRPRPYGPNYHVR